jgi:hypothetical protein
MEKPDHDDSKATKREGYSCVIAEQFARTGCSMATCAQSCTPHTAQDVET